MPAIHRSQKKALCIGIEYQGSANSVSGAYKDCYLIEQVLTNKFGYTVTLLMDDGIHRSPTRANILAEIQRLVGEAQSGDKLFLHYSGHGAQIPDESGDESDKLDEVLIPVDPNMTPGEGGVMDPCDESRPGWRDNIIMDDELFHIITKLPAGCTLNALFDTCNSGTALDLPYNLRFKQQGLKSQDICNCASCEECETRKSPTETISYRWPKASKAYSDCISSDLPSFGSLMESHKDSDPDGPTIRLFAACRDGTHAHAKKAGGFLVCTFVKILQDYDISKKTLGDILCATDRSLRKKAIKPHLKERAGSKPEDHINHLQYFQYSSLSNPLFTYLSRFNRYNTVPFTQQLSGSRRVRLRYKPANRRAFFFFKRIPSRNDNVSKPSFQYSIAGYND